MALVITKLLHDRGTRPLGGDVTLQLACSEETYVAFTQLRGTDIEAALETAIAQVKSTQAFRQAMTAL